MVIAPRGACQHHAVRMEGRGGDRGRGLSGLVQEAGVGLYAREFSAFEVEDFDGVGARAAVLC
jgi:hypothetical protein